MKTKKWSVVIGVLVCGALMLTTAILPTALPAGHAGTTDITRGEPGETPSAPPGTSVPIREPDLPIDSSGVYAAGLVNSFYTAYNLDDFAMPDYLYNLHNGLSEAAIYLNMIPNPYYSEALPIVLDMIPEIDDWLTDQTMADSLVDQLETLVALMYYEQDPIYKISETPVQLFNGAQSGYKFDYDAFLAVQHYELIRTQSAYKLFWAEHNQGVRPAVNFGQQTVVMAYLGVRNTGGYNIDILDVYTVEDNTGAIMGGTIVEVGRWSPTGNVPQVITNPCHIVAIQKIEPSQPVIFLDTNTGNIIDIVYF